MMLHICTSKYHHRSRQTPGWDVVPGYCSRSADYCGLPPIRWSVPMAWGRLLSLRHSSPARRVAWSAYPTPISWPSPVQARQSWPPFLLSSQADTCLTFKLTSAVIIPPGSRLAVLREAGLISTARQLVWCCAAVWR
jgi:hypothetical protein